MTVILSIGPLLTKEEGLQHIQLLLRLSPGSAQSVLQTTRKCPRRNLLVGVLIALKAVWLNNPGCRHRERRGRFDGRACWKNHWVMPTIHHRCNGLRWWWGGFGGILAHGVRVLELIIQACGCGGKSLFGIRRKMKGGPCWVTVFLSFAVPGQEISLQVPGRLSDSSKFCRLDCAAVIEGSYSRRLVFWIFTEVHRGRWWLVVFLALIGLVPGITTVPSK